MITISSTSRKNALLLKLYRASSDGFVTASRSLRVSFSSCVMPSGRKMKDTTSGSMFDVRTLTVVLCNVKSRLAIDITIYRIQMTSSLAGHYYK